MILGLHRKAIFQTVPMPLPFDATLKVIVTEHPGDFATLFGLPTTEPVSTINIDLFTLSAATDVALAYGEPLQTIVDLNFQTGSDAALPGRLHLYSAALYNRHEVPVRSIEVAVEAESRRREPFRNIGLRRRSLWSRISL